MQSRGKSRPQTAAERQRKCRALKRGDPWYTPSAGTVKPLYELPDGTKCDPRVPPQKLLTDWRARMEAAALTYQPGPNDSSKDGGQKQLEAKGARALPAPPITALERVDAGDESMLPVPADNRARGWDEIARLKLPPAVAARLRSLLERDRTGQTLSPAERAEAQGLLDIAEFFTEYFAISRLRKQLAA